jgi:hypothetical protein
VSYLFICLLISLNWQLNQQRLLYLSWWLNHQRFAAVPAIPVREEVRCSTIQTVVLCSTCSISSTLYCVLDVVLVLCTSGKEKQQLILVLEVCTVLSVPGTGTHLATPLFLDLQVPVLVQHRKIRISVIFRAISIILSPMIDLKDVP